MSLTRTEAPAPTGEAQWCLLGVAGDNFHVSFRDVFYDCGPAEAGEMACWVSGVALVVGVNTDTFIYASLDNSALTMVLVPGHLFECEGRQQIDEVYARGGTLP